MRHAILGNYLKYRSMALCIILRDSSPLVSLFFLWPRRRTLHSGPCQVLAAPFVSRYIFQDGGIGTSTSFGGRSFIHCFVERVERLRMFIHSDRVKVLYCFVWNYWEPGNVYLLEMTISLLLCFVCLCFTGLGIIRILRRCWRKNIPQNGHWMFETSCKVDLQLSVI